MYAYPKPNIEQTTVAAASLTYTHTPPQTPSFSTSRRPSRGLEPPTSLTANNIVMHTLIVPCLNFFCVMLPNKEVLTKLEEDREIVKII